MRYRKFTSGVLYLRSKSSKDTSSPAFTSSINWTSVLAIASTTCKTRALSKSCARAQSKQLQNKPPSLRGNREYFLRFAGPQPRFLPFFIRGRVLVAPALAQRPGTPKGPFVSPVPGLLLGSGPRPPHTE